MIKRCILLLTLTLVFTGGFAQKQRLDSIKWITPSLGHLYFANKKVYFNSAGNNIVKSGYLIIKDTLKMMDVYTSSDDNFKVKHTNVFKFIIRKFNQDKLVIQAANNNALRLAGPDEIEFANYRNSFDSGIRVSKIYFLSSACRDQCTQLAIEIWPNGEYHLKGGDYSEPYKGNYIGTLSKTQLDSLNYLLKRSELKKMNNWRQTDDVADAQTYYFDIDFVGSKDQVSINTNQPPINMTDLIRFMMGTYKKVNLTKVQQFPQGSRLVNY